MKHYFVVMAVSAEDEAENSPEDWTSSIFLQPLIELTEQHKEALLAQSSRRFDYDTISWVPGPVMTSNLKDFDLG